MLQLENTLLWNMNQWTIQMNDKEKMIDFIDKYVEERFRPEKE